MLTTIAGLIKPDKILDHKMFLRAMLTHKCTMIQNIFRYSRTFFAIIVVANLNVLTCKVKERYFVYCTSRYRIVHAYA